MKNLRNVTDRVEIAGRLGRVRAGSVRRWGKLSAHEMLCHLCDSFRGAMG